MKSKFLMLASLLLVFVAMTAFVMAEDDSSTTNDDNWCFEGGPWGDGRCNSDDPFQQDYYWLSGWCHAQTENGNLEGSADDCIGDNTEEETVADDESKDSKDTKKSSALCYTSGDLDFKFSGKYNKFGNIKVSETDGNCSGKIVQVDTIVNTNEPDATCEDLIKPPYVIYGSGSTPAGVPYPADTYFCTYYDSSI